jgi:hypothetical protein
MTAVFEEDGTVSRVPPVRSEPLLAELCGILSAALARGLDSEHPGCRVLLELPMTEADYMRLRTIVEANDKAQILSEAK